MKSPAEALWRERAAKRTEDPGRDAGDALGAASAAWAGAE
jgi:hypothetical protein